MGVVLIGAIKIPRETLARVGGPQIFGFNGELYFPRGQFKMGGGMGESGPRSFNGREG